MEKSLPLQGYMAFLDTLHVEADGGNGTASIVSDRYKLAPTAAAWGAVEKSMNEKTAGRRVWHEATRTYSMVNSPP